MLYSSVFGIFSYFHVAETHVGAPDKGAPKIPNGEFVFRKNFGTLKNTYEYIIWPETRVF